MLKCPLTEKLREVLRRMIKIGTIVGRVGFENDLALQLAKNVDVKCFANTEDEAMELGRKQLNRIAEDLDDVPRINFVDDEYVDIYEIDSFDTGERTIVGWEIETYISEVFDA